MEKEKLKTVGAGALKSAQKGITLIALVITIIVMLILVAVTITMAVNGGLFEYAQSAGRQTNEAKANEQLLASGQVNIDNVIYNSIDEYIETIKGAGNKEPLPKYEEANFSNGYLTENADYTSGSYTAVIPAGFKVSEVEGESTITTGLVIKDAQGNEFVWIPVTKTLVNSYEYAEGYSEPAAVELDAANGYTKASFESEYQTMVASVNNNDGFYIGRYETTTDANSNVGSKYNTPILTSQNWYTLYEAQKTANIPGNGTNVQTAMVYGVLWDETLAFIGQNNSNYSFTSGIAGCSRFTDSTVRNSGVSNTADNVLNIWGLSYNYMDWTQESYSDVVRVCRAYAGPNNDTGRHSATGGYYAPIASNTKAVYASRLIMYVL